MARNPSLHRLQAPESFQELLFPPPETAAAQAADFADYQLTTERIAGLIKRPVVRGAARQHRGHSPRQGTQPRRPPHHARRTSHPLRYVGPGGPARAPYEP